MRILIFGDSIVQGHFDSHGGWSARVANDYGLKTLHSRETEFTEVYSLGVSANTVEDVIERIEHEAKARYDGDEKPVIVLAAGLNNSILRDNRAYTDIYKFESTYEKLIHKARKISSQLLCIGLTAVDEVLTNPYGPSNTGNQYLNNRINLFEDCIKQVCGRENVPFVPIHDMFIGQLDSKRSLLADGLHPDDAGHSLLYEMIAPEIKKLSNKIK